MEINKDSLRTELGYDSMEPVLGGWSTDKKYRVAKADGSSYLLRLSSPEKRKRIYEGFRYMEQISAFNIPMCMPLACGECSEGIYTIHSWIDGEEGSEKLSDCTDTQAYVYGLQAGSYLRKIHQIAAPAGQEDWESRFNKKIDRNIRCYRESSEKVEGGSLLIGYIQENRGLLKGRPQCFQHGDYHSGNMMIADGKLVVIDFDRWDFGDPWEEFNRIVWSAQCNPLFASGIINGYFDGEPPVDFFKLMALYIASNILSSVVWALQFGAEQVGVMKKQAGEVLEWFDGMKNPVPKWYFKGYYIQYTKGTNLPYKLKSPFDFSFLEEYGEIFQVYDDQDSGNICFGVRGTSGEKKRYFIKFAGAPAERSEITQDEAIQNLIRTVTVYHKLAHPNLIRLIDAKETGGGFAMIFEWTDGVCMGRMYPQSHRKFMNFSAETKLQIYDSILDFHCFAAEQGYAAVDFYDSSILFEFHTGKTLLCDIDFYRKAPFINEMGRMWGSSRFMSPEEFVLGARIDEVTNVYTMGAAAFALFGENMDRSLKKWTLGPATYEAAAKAVSTERDGRQQSLGMFAKEWNKAKQYDNR